MPEGALFYGETKRRVVVPFDAELRALTEDDGGRRSARSGRQRRDAAAGLARGPLPRLLAASSSAARRPWRSRRSRLARRGWSRPLLGRGDRVKKLLNTLYVTTEGAGLRKDGENLVAEVDGAERARVPLHMLASVVVFGGIFVSPPLIGACARGRHHHRAARPGRAASRRASKGPSPATCCCAARSTAPRERPRTSCAASSSARSPTSARC